MHFYSVLDHREGAWGLFMPPHWISLAQWCILCLPWFYRFELGRTFLQSHSVHWTRAEDLSVKVSTVGMSEAIVFKSFCAACKHLALKSLHLKNIFMLKLYQVFAIMWTFWHSGEGQYCFWHLSHNCISVNASCFLIQFTDHLLVSWFCLLLTWKIPQILGRFHNLLMKWITNFTWKLV